MQQSLARHHRRPLGVTIVAAILAIHGILDVLLGIIILVGALALGHVISSHGHTTAGTAVDTVGVILGGITLAIGLVKLIVPVGLLATRSLLRESPLLWRPEPFGLTHQLCISNRAEVVQSRGT